VGRATLGREQVGRPAAALPSLDVLVGCVVWLRRPVVAALRE
jgi:hypothetical protein